MRQTVNLLPLDFGNPKEGREANTLRITEIVLLVNGGIQWVRNLRCPYCGRGYAMPWWRKGEKHFCDRCGREIVFDDPEDPTEKRKGE